MSIVFTKGTEREGESWYESQNWIHLALCHFFASQILIHWYNCVPVISVHINSNGPRDIGPDKSKVKNTLFEHVLCLTSHHTSLCLKLAFTIRRHFYLSQAELVLLCVNLIAAISPQLRRPTVTYLVSPCESLNLALTNTAKCADVAWSHRGK